MRDTVSNIGVVQAIAPAVHSATVTSDEVEMQGFNSATVVISTGAIAGGGDFTAKVVWADEIDSPLDWTDIEASDLIGSLPAKLEGSKVYKVGVKKAARYLGVVLTKNGGTSIAASAVVLKGHPAIAPVA